MAFYKNTPAHQIDYTMRKTGNSHAQSMRAKIRNFTKIYIVRYAQICYYYIVKSINMKYGSTHFITVTIHRSKGQLVFQNCVTHKKKRISSHSSCI